MISKQQQKYVQSLHNKKYRTEFKEFLVEGEKAILELIDSDFEIVKVYCSDTLAKKLKAKNLDSILLNEKQLEDISTLKSNTAGVAIVKQKSENTNLDFKKALVLDNIRDPGNLGTIIRLADWYGIKNIVCSIDTVEFYNPKTISASMGSFCRVNCHYTDLTSFLNQSTLMKFGAFLEGENVHSCHFPDDFLLIIGSESHGIALENQKFIDKKITIPKFGQAESLNAAVATGIILDNIFRNK